MKISIHVPREGDDTMKISGFDIVTISIHVPREGDDMYHSTRLFLQNISIHVPREGDDVGRVQLPNHLMPFLSTSPARGTTLCCVNVRCDKVFLSTSPARGTTPPGGGLGEAELL